MNSKIYRSTKDKVFTGVVGGLGTHFKIDSTLLRLVGVILTFATGLKFLVIYIICSFLIPERPEHLAEDEAEVVDENGNSIRTGLSANSRTIIGVVAIAFGGMLLTDNLFRWMNHDYYWGACLILVGIIVIVSSRRKNEEFK